jgi:hypothetical protein
MNKHELIEALVKSFALGAFAVVPCLHAIAYAGWLKIQSDLSPRRNFLGAASIVLSFVNWLSIVYFYLAISTHWGMTSFTNLWCVVGLFLSAPAIVLSLTLKKYPRVLAFAAAMLVTALWTLIAVAGR